MNCSQVKPEPPQNRSPSRKLQLLILIFGLWVKCFSFHFFFYSHNNGMIMLNFFFFIYRHPLLYTPIFFTFCTAVDILLETKKKPACVGANFFFPVDKIGASPWKLKISKFAQSWWNKYRFCKSYLLFLCVESSSSSNFLDYKQQASQRFEFNSNLTQII